MSVMFKSDRGNGKESWVIRNPPKSNHIILRFYLARLIPTDFCAIFTAQC